MTFSRIEKERRNALSAWLLDRFGLPEHASPDSGHPESWWWKDANDCLKFLRTNGLRLVPVTALPPSDKSVVTRTLEEHSVWDDDYGGPEPRMRCACNREAATPHWMPEQGFHQHQADMIIQALNREGEDDE